VLFRYFPDWLIIFSVERCSKELERRKPMRAAAPRVKEIKEVGAGPVLVYSAPATAAIREEGEPLQREYGRDGDIFKGMLVALIIEVAVSACIYLVWQIGQLFG